jgi:hypothetical protein
MSTHRPLLLLILLTLWACDDATPPPDPVPGPVTYRLASPHGDEGAVLFTAPAAAVTDVIPDCPACGDQVVTEEAGGVLHVAVIRLLSGEIRVRLEVADVDAPPTLTLLEVVDPSNRPRALDGYALEVVR